VPTLDAFLERYAMLLANCFHALKPAGIMAVLMGDYFDIDFGFVPLVYHTLCGHPHNMPNVVQLVMWPQVFISLVSAKKSFAAPHNSATFQNSACSLPIRTEA
jgi:hypothetical protein